MKRALFLSLLVTLSLSFEPAVRAQGSPSIENDPSYIKFQGGDGQRFRGQDPSFYPALLQAILGYPGVKFNLPDFEGKPECYVPLNGLDRLVTGDLFEQLMIHAVPPSEQSKFKYVKMTNETTKAVEKAVLASSGNLTPADIMTMSLRASNGNFPLAALTAHNFLKEIAYGGRDEYKKLVGLIAQGKNYQFPNRYGDVAAKLVNLRTAKGDKMGIWYHSFVPVAITAWTNVPVAGDNAITDEYLARRALSMGSPVDPEKQSCDEKFSKICHAVHKAYALQIPKMKVCHAEVTPKLGPVGTKFKLNITYQLADAPAPVFVNESIDVVGEQGSTIVVSKSKRTITRGTRDSEREFESSPVKEGKYNFKVALETGGFKKDLLLPFTVAPSAGLVAGAPEIVINGVAKEDVKITPTSVTLKRWMYNKQTNAKDTFWDVINYSPVPPSLVPAQNVVLKASFVVPRYEPDELNNGQGPKHSALWHLGDLFGEPLQIEHFMEVNSQKGEPQLESNLIGPHSSEYTFKTKKPPAGHVPVIILQTYTDGGAYVRQTWRYMPPKPPASN